MDKEFSVTESFISVLKNMQRDLHKRKEALRSESCILEYDIREFEYYLSNMKKLLGKSSKEKLSTLWTFKDSEDVYEQLREMRVMSGGKGVKLFSEGYLYDTIGKEDARTVLALLNSIYANNGRSGGF